ncbi:SusC/RagA family TonB-linked outer membrane protein [Mucilaginibacter pedocola]|uniref:SusC/RagA family TonB-linked outer membrane protein n=1 Tax=Mucilaginibacter pedocola TaxID=1792845 RepID=A0A1S9P783_9SPHI|nr:TonB-dependent receptor [Mucilaginibacter pedocola]OOQ56508.1 SusC/RagA family TonB-linked outer membrane protein [Mucilaginibacter pedocola]
MNKVYLFKYGLSVLFLLCTLTTFAQKARFSGTVVDERNLPLPGATVTVKETGATTVTDKDGAFSIANSNLQTLTITVNFVGFDALEKTISADQPAKFALNPSARSLNEVVVVGYGTVRKKDLTGSVSTVGAKDLNPGAVTNPLQQLDGKAAGVNITQVGSEPGVAPTIRIRGITSLQGGNDPLVVVDGIQGNMDLLNQVPPSEIASIDVLKDASATAIYGSRGAPGVIIVTTKKGTAGKTSVEYAENTSLDVIANKLKLLTAEQWTAQAQAQGVDASANHGSNTDWFNLLTRNGVTQNHTLSFGGGANEFNYRASLTAINQTGIVINSKYKKYIGRIVATQKALDDKLTLTMNVNSGINQFDYSPTGVGNAAFTSNLISQTYISRPTDPVLNANGTFYSDPNVFQYTNPYAVATTVQNTNNVNNLFGSLRADLEIYKGLSAGWFGSWRKADSNNGYYAPAASTITSAINYNGQAHINNDHVDEKLMDINLTYKKDFGANHFDATAVYEWQAQTYNGSYSAARGFANDIATYNALQLGTLANALSGDVASYKNDRRLVSFLGRVNYSYKNRYLLTASFRRDGSTVFGENHKWGNFPSASLAWRVDQEGFLKNQRTLSSLKLRVGYGVTGNQQGITPQNSIALVGLNSQTPTVYFGGQLIPNYFYTQNANPNLRWETKKQANAGLDFGFFGDRLTGSVDAYTATTDNLLFRYTVPVTGSFFVNNILANIGSLRSRGLELALAYTVIRTENTTLTLAGNGALQQSKVMSLGGNIQGLDVPTNYVGLGSNAYLIKGKPIGTFLILHHLGKDANNAETVVDQDGNGVIDQGDQSKDRVEAGQSLPKYTYAFTPTFTYKNFDASMVWRGAGGNKIYNGLRQTLSLQENLGKSNLLQSALPLGIASSGYGSDLWLEDGSYLRFQNLSFGYRINVPKVKYISSLRVSLTGQNLAVITKYSGIDPEVNAGGLASGDYGTYPRTRTFSIGLNVVLK